MTTGLTGRQIRDKTVDGDDLKDSITVNPSGSAGGGLYVRGTGGYLLSASAGAGAVSFSGSVSFDGGLTVAGDSLEMTGSLSVTGGISGSLTRLADGSTYLRAGSGISVVSGSDGSVTVSATGGGGGGMPDLAYVLVNNVGHVFENERILSGGSGITITDGGPGGTITISAAGGGADTFATESTAGRLSGSTMSTVLRTVSLRTSGTTGGSALWTHPIGVNEVVDVSGLVMAAGQGPRFWSQEYAGTYARISSGSASVINYSASAKRTSGAVSSWDARLRLAANDIIMEAINSFGGGVVDWGADFKINTLRTSDTALPPDEVPGPESITGLYLWTRADIDVYSDDAGTAAASSGEGVALWKDASGNGRHWRQTTASQRPTLRSSVADQFLGRPAIEFDATNDGMAGGITGLSAPFTIYIVWSTQSTAGGGRRILNSASTNWLVGPWGGYYSYYAGSFASLGAATVVANTPIVHKVVQAGGGGEHFKNGVSLGTVSYPTDPGNLALASAGSFSETAGSWVAEIVIFDRVLTAAEDNTLTTYFGSRYGTS